MFSVCYRLKIEWTRSRPTAQKPSLKLFNCCSPFTAACTWQGSLHPSEGLISSWSLSSRGPLPRKPRRSSTVSLSSCVNTCISTHGCWMIWVLGEWPLCRMPAQECFPMVILSTSGFSRWGQFIYLYIKLPLLNNFQILTLVVPMFCCFRIGYKVSVFESFDANVI